MSKIRTLATIALMAGLVGGAYWVSLPSGNSTATQVSALLEVAEMPPA